MAMKCRIGIDFGETIGRVEDHADSAGAYPYSLEMIRHLVFQFGSDHVFIVSKAGPQMQQRISQWLKDATFFQKTNMKRSNLIFCRQYLDKVAIVEKLQISVFFDDNFKVVSSLSKLKQVKRIFWMHADTRQLKQIARGHRNKIAITHSWSNTMKYFQKIHPDKDANVKGETR
ncbi:unnamed protein product [Cylindrotheca closterium]|uniref:Uncharacterized protein n=1 Tax=Cylindrotheca closterium TaxID=2856 RepID=A0AAD2GAT1_9STRA|nr:unnamed protein product [Cylindrotheca closterium]